MYKSLCVRCLLCVRTVSFSIYQYVRKYRFLGDFFFLSSFFLDSYYDSPEIGVISKRPRPFMEPEIA